MTRYLLDTNIVSNALKPFPSEHLAAWMTERSDEDLFVASMTIAELWSGILSLPGGRKRDTLERWFVSLEGPLQLLAGRILPFDAKAALIWGRLMAEGRRVGRPRNATDMIVASVAEAHECIVATENERDFFGIPFVDPMRG